jgi:predicted CopG family antitoxin
MARILSLHSKDENTAFSDFIETLSKAYKENRLRTMICIAGINYEKGKEREGFVNKIADYWFLLDGNCTETIGLLEVMKAKILEYMRVKDAAD